MYLVSSIGFPYFFVSILYREFACFKLGFFEVRLTFVRLFSLKKNSTSKTALMSVVTTTYSFIMSKEVEFVEEIESGLGLLITSLNISLTSLTDIPYLLSARRFA